MSSPKIARTAQPPARAEASVTRPRALLLRTLIADALGDEAVRPVKPFAALLWLQFWEASFSLPQRANQSCSEQWAAAILKNPPS